MSVKEKLQAIGVVVDKDKPEIHPLGIEKAGRNYTPCVTKWRN
jgi:hypothetical protein